MAHQSDRAAHVLALGHEVYLWPRGAYVHVYGFSKYVARLAGDANSTPDRSVRAGKFGSFAEFQDWCKRQHMISPRF